MDEPVTIDRSMLMARLATLKSEYTSGRRMLVDLEARTATLHEQLLRIGGAVQVLEELLQAGEDRADTTTAPASGHTGVLP